MTHAALVGLPSVVFVLVPELTRPLPEEGRADCGACPLAALPESDSAHMSDEVRCCSYHPMLPGWLVGRALRAGGVAERVVQRRMADPDGVRGAGIVPSDAHRGRYRAEARGGFGRDVTLRCPYWVGGARACGVWEHRGAVCRTWFCRHEQGVAGHHLWMTVRDTLRVVEGAIARALAHERPPPADDAPGGAKRGWYRWAAARVDGLSPGAVVCPELPSLRAALRDAFDALAAPIPDVVTARVAAVLPLPGDRVRLIGYSGWDPVDAPRSVFVFLSRLDGVTSWADAGGDPAFVAELWRAGLLEAASGAPFAPGMTVTVRRGGQEPETWHLPPDQVPEWS